MALYASHARGTHGLDLATLGAISAPLPSLSPGQLYIASSERPVAGPRRPKGGQPQPMAVQSSTKQPSGQRT